MNIISISTDRKIFEEGSQVRDRMVEYGRVFDFVHIVIFAKENIGIKSGVVKISENVFAYPTNSKNKLFYILDAFKIAKNISKTLKLKGENYVVTTQDPFETGFVGLMLKWTEKLPLNVQIHTDFTNRFFIFNNILNLIRFPLGIFVLSFADSVRTVSERILGSIKTLAHNISVLPVYVEMNTSHESKEMGDGPVDILTVCRLEKEKDLKTALNAFKRLLQSGVDAQFNIVGDGSEKMSLLQFAKSIGILEKVNFLGWHKNPENFYEKANIYISTSLYEGYGMSVVEAASFGVPLVISNTGVAGSLFKDGESALIFNQKNEKGFASGLIKLSNDLNLRKKIGDNARSAALYSVLSMDNYLSKYKHSMEAAALFYSSAHGVFKKNILFRYLVAGSLGAGTQIGLLYFFTDILTIWYLYSSIFSFGSAILISFTLQKFWTFKDEGIKRLHYQFLKYFLLAVFGIIINSIIMYFLVDILNTWYIFAQILTSIVIAVINFIAYKFFIFNK